MIMGNAKRRIFGCSAFESPDIRNAQNNDERNKKMKKLISCMLILALVLSLGVVGAVASAEDAENDTMKFEEMGLTLKLPEEFAKAKGLFEPYPLGDIGDGVNFMMFFYVGMDRDAYDAAVDNTNLTEEEQEEVQKAMSVLGYLFTIDGGRTAIDLAKRLEEPDEMAEEYIEVGKAEDVTFYLWLDKGSEEVSLNGLKPEYAEEFLTLQNKLVDALKNSEFSVPVAPGSELVGQVLSFETKDIDGNPVKSEDIFSKNDVTVVNVWATWCGPCRSELEELGEIDRRLADLNCAVVGICDDGGEVPDEAKALIEENGMDYLNIVPFDNMDEILAIQGYPTTVFVGRDGTILALPVIGVPNDLSLYEDTVNALLAGKAPAEAVGSAETNTTVPSENGKYNVVVRNSEGDPVKGVTVQFCSDITCTLGKTDENGVASFDADEGQVYTVHILKVPEGVEKTSEEFQTLDTYSDTYIVLQKAA